MIDINTGFNISGSPIDARFVLTKDKNEEYARLKNA